jgi:hypothetical protein
MKKYFSILTFLLMQFFVFTQERIHFKAELGMDSYDLNLYEVNYYGAKLHIGMELVRNLTSGLTIGYNRANSLASVRSFGLETRYYFSRTKSLSGIFADFNIMYNPFRISPELTYASGYDIPQKVVSIMVNVGYQKVLKNNLTLGAKIGGGIFNKYFGYNVPQLPRRTQIALEIGYLL